MMKSELKLEINAKEEKMEKGPPIQTNKQASSKQANKQINNKNNINLYKTTTTATTTRSTTTLCAIVTACRNIISVALLIIRQRCHY